MSALETHGPTPPPPGPQDLAPDLVSGGNAARAAKDALYHQVRETLLAGNAEGRGLSSRSLAERFGVGRGRIRNVLHQLEVEGLVERRPQSGTYPRQVMIDELRQLFDVRLAIEPRAALLAAARMTPDDIAELEACNESVASCLRAVEGCPDLRRDDALVRAVMQAEMAFHRRILVVAGNPLFVKIYEDMHILAQLFQRTSNRQPTYFSDSVQRTLREHGAITVALAAGDAEAARDAMTSHLSTGLRVLEEDPHLVVP